MPDELVTPLEAETSADIPVDVVAAPVVPTVEVAPEAIPAVVPQARAHDFDFDMALVDPEAQRYMGSLRGESKARREMGEELQGRVDELTRRLEVMRIQGLTDGGDFEEASIELAKKVKEFEPYKSKYEALLQSIRERNEERVTALPARLQALVPEGLHPTQLESWLINASNAGVLGNSPPATDGGRGIHPARQPADEAMQGSAAQAELAQAYGHNVTAEMIAEQKRKLASKKKTN